MINPEKPIPHGEIEGKKSIESNFLIDKEIENVIKSIIQEINRLCVQLSAMNFPAFEIELIPNLLKQIDLWFKHHNEMGDNTRAHEIVHGLTKKYKKELLASDLLDNNETISQIAETNTLFRKNIIKVIELYNLALLRKQEVISNRDTLTGLNNRKVLEDNIKNEIKNLTFINREGEKRKRKEKSFLIIIDINSFKRINDKGVKGHPEGDEVLRKIALILENSFRQEDTKCRYGGDEFAITINGITHKRLEQEIFKMIYKISSIEYQCIEEGKTVSEKVSVSMGVTEINTGDTMNETILRADSASYASKVKSPQDFAETGKFGYSFLEKGDERPSYIPYKEE